MQKKIKYILGILLLGLTASVKAQQETPYTQYIFNMLTVNPAYSGVVGDLSITSMYRGQWVALEGAPTTFSISAHAPFKKSSSSIGGHIFADQIGVTRNTGFFFSYAYRLKLSTSLALNFGIQIGGDHYTHSLDQLTVIPQPGENIDQVFQSGRSSKFSINGGAGVYFTGEKFYFGVSAPKMLRPDSFEATEGLGTIERHFYVTGGFVQDISNRIRLKPNFMVRKVGSAPLSVDLGAYFLIDDIYWVGPSYRIGESISLMFDVKITNRIRLGYSFDYLINSAQSIASSSHELMINYRFSKREAVDEIISPRFF